MQPSLAGKIEKAKRYAEEPERVTIHNLSADFRGENDSHSLSLSDGKWFCNCHFFTQWGQCVHIMTLQRLLDRMLPVPVDTSRQA